MIILAKDERMEFKEFERKLYACIVSKKGLESYFLVPYLNYNNGMVEFDIDQFNNDLKFLSSFNIGEELKFVRDCYSYSDFITKMQPLAYRAFDIECIKNCLITFPIFEDKSLTEEIIAISDEVNSVVSANEEFFKKQIVPQIPVNWPYAMFESSWTGYDFLVRKHDFAQGYTDIDAKILGCTLRDIEYLSHKNAKSAEREMKIYNGLNEKIKAQEERTKKE